MSAVRVTRLTFGYPAVLRGLPGSGPVARHACPSGSALWPDHTCEMDQSGDLVSRKAESGGLPDALPGRMEIIELWPFSQGELERSPDAFADAAFARGPGLSRTSTMRKRDYLDRVVRGGYPEAIRRSPRRRAAFFDSYLTNLIERDVKELAAIERRGDLRRLLARYGMSPAGRDSGGRQPAAP